MNSTSNFCLLIFALLIAWSTVPKENINLDTGLVAYYTFNSCDARDESGNGSDGKMFGDIACWCGVENDALLLDGINDYIEFEGLINRYFNTSDFTLSFYIKPDRMTIFNQSLVSKTPLCETYTMLDLQLDLRERAITTFFHETPDKHFGDLSPELTSPGWFHYALVRKGTRAYTYINGQIQKEGRRCSGVDITNDAIFNFSNSPCIETGKLKRFKGLLDQFRVYDHALTDLEIAALYAKYPIEKAEVDCLTFQPKKVPQDLYNETERSYLCAY